ncbi:hypothetical protein LB505_003526 [Fusarium chuoi]|nr:hypothetical protein LB505_003526 [Fusarium chuoi]
MDTNLKVPKIQTGLLLLLEQELTIMMSTISYRSNGHSWPLSLRESSNMYYSSVFLCRWSRKALLLSQGLVPFPKSRCTLPTSQSRQNTRWP